MPYVASVLGPDGGPIVAATDWMKALPDMVCALAPPSYVSLGTDGFGRSDTREALRSHFEIDPPHIAAAALGALVRCGAVTPATGRQGDRRARARSGPGGAPHRLRSAREFPARSPLFRAMHVGASEAG